MQAQGSSALTGQYLNGRGWRSLTPDTKIGYVVAMSEAPVLCDTKSDNNHFIFNEVLTRAEIIDAIDRFYVEPENIGVIVVSAYRFVALKANGATEQQLSAELSRLRAVAANLSQK